ncbi:hypothetical protein OsI_35161 [Oryza sativa Indica Group]|uniref:Uncharacterized protein n=1 Tax=Oryza sativa subsp. indica TaxID=39946 RepID=A2ZBK7_ORYSI|nr:hypothetical protein OsI_35159 [Oryza sativa Indica Group]EAY79993.1 hypothetical protein OsI_35161 [Oryza sativa Indica Group]
MAALPALLPTPPRSKMLPLLPTPCLVILPANFATSVASNAPKPGRADAADRWDAHKKPTSSSSSSSSSTGSASRAAACERKEPGSPASSSSSSGGKPGRADSCERWDTNKAKNQIISSGRLTPASSSSTNARWDMNKVKNTAPPSNSNKRPVSRGSASAERWDISKKHRSQDAAAAALGSASDRKLTTVAKPQQPLFSGPAFLTSPEPSMLPMPTFLMAR